MYVYVYKEMHRLDISGSSVRSVSCKRVEYRYCTHTRELDVYQLVYVSCKNASYLSNSIFLM